MELSRPKYPEMKDGGKGEVQKILTPNFKILITESDQGGHLTHFHFVLGKMKLR